MLIRYAIRVSFIFRLGGYVGNGHARSRTTDFKPCQNEKWLIDSQRIFVSCREVCSNHHLPRVVVRLLAVRLFGVKISLALACHWNKSLPTLRVCIVSVAGGIYINAFHEKT